MVFKNRILSKSIAFLILFFFSIFTFAETIYLKDGSVIKGEIISQDENVITISTSVGIIKVYLDKIAKIEYEGREVKVLLRDGSLLIGKIINQDEKDVRLETLSGLLVIQKDKIKNIEFIIKAKGNEKNIEEQKVREEEKKPEAVAGKSIPETQIKEKKEFPWLIVGGIAVAAVIIIISLTRSKTTTTTSTISTTTTTVSHTTTTTVPPTTTTTVPPTTTTTIPGSVALIDLYHGRDGSSVALSYGYSIVVNNSSITSSTLSGIRVYFLYLPNVTTYSFSSTELNVLQNFVNSGGNILVVGGEDTSTPTRANPLTTLFGMTLGGDTGQTEYMNSFVSHPITSGVSSVTYIGADPITVSSPAKALGYFRSGTLCGLAIYEPTGKGKVVVFADGPAGGDLTRLWQNTWNYLK